jgi:hypothetical protein
MGAPHAHSAGVERSVVDAIISVRLFTKASLLR